MSKKQTKPYDQMTTAELREATREFDQSGVMARARPLSAKDRELHRRAKKMGRPVKGAGATVVGVSIEKGLLKQADAVSKWASDAESGIAGARKELKGWKDGLDKTNLKVKFQANIADLEAKVAKAQKELKDPNLTKVRQAQLKANIADLTEKIRLAKGGLSQPQLVATKIAKFQADKTDLDRKIAAAQFELKAPSLTATRRAHLQAEIGQLLAAKARAQASINSLQGKTVKVVLDTYKNMIQTTIVGGIGVKLPGHAKGGPVKRGQPYVVGEEGPEVFVSNESGSIIPNGATAGGRGAMGGGAPVVLRIDSSGSRIDDLLVELLQKAVRNRGGNVQLVLGRNS